MPEKAATMADLKLLLENLRKKSAAGSRPGAARL